MKHTKTPWRVAPVSDYAGAGINVDAGQTGYVAAFGFRGDAEAEANADFAVNAANCHDELVSALEECAAHIDGALGASERPGSDSADIYEQAMAALAKAKGGTP